MYLWLYLVALSMAEVNYGIKDMKKHTNVSKERLYEANCYTAGKYFIFIAHRIKVFADTF